MVVMAALAAALHLIIWPRSSRGFPLTLLITVRAAGKRAIVKYHVVAHA